MASADSKVPLGSWVPPNLIRRTARAGAGASPGELPQPSVGDRMGRYTVLELLGYGGMGVVYKAYDPQLDRNVALKLLRRASRDGEEASELRLLREAQVLAQLEHPNVIAVYDAGLSERGVFVAMELFPGQTLGEWLDERPRSVPEILEVFRAAGRGLAAAHQAGIVHRDFKPANVLVGRDGSVRVLDFGIAALMEPPPGDSTTTRRGVARPPGAVDRRPSWPGATTEVGVVMGTPQFMAPEQLAGVRADFRCDQFAFCVCLHLALYGRSPVMGSSFEERRMHLARGRVLDQRVSFAGGRKRRVPARVRRALRRGLSMAPDARLPSMQALVDALETSPRRWPVLAACLLLGSGFGAGALVFGAPVDARPEVAARSGAVASVVERKAPPTVVEVRREEPGTAVAPPREEGPSVDAGIAWANQGSALASRGRHDEAYEAFVRARSTFERTVGGEHPLTTFAMDGLCRAELSRGHHARAVELCGRVLERLAASRSSPAVMARAGFVLARALQGAGQRSQAHATAVRAMELARAEDPRLADELAAWIVVRAAQ